MKVTQIYLLLHLILTTSVLVDTLSVTGFMSNLWKRLSFQGSCDSLKFNAEGLRADLESKLFGQHIASPIIQKAVTGFMNDDNPKKPLVLSLHGPTGTGKNFVSKLIADNIYKKGMDSNRVHVFVSTYHFPHPSQIDIYKSQLQEWIKGNVTKCERSMFIFDEMDQMHPGLIDSIMVYLGYYHKLDGVSYRKVIFLFLSNAGSKVIIETALKFWKEGREREAIELKDVEKDITESVLNNNLSGFWHSRLIEKSMVDFFVPFLPLEYGHIIKCVMAEMKAKGLELNQDVAHSTANEFIYFPTFERVFSVKGCKSVENRMKFYI
ncbi:torsin-1A-like [Anabas testudineus]|uniref:Torsin n=1 Tax=Anabas testudineus TaxID=64144 RepID=A0A3Q1I8C1_ANATE|nr:torsin-1A-like [Anabas testudineus]